MQDECLICGAPLEYLAQDELMECAVCHRSYMSKTRCVRGHYVCDECHRQGLDAVFGVCLAETSRDPAEILDRMMAMPFCHMHGPEHHIMVGAALLTAYKKCRRGAGSGEGAVRHPRPGPERARRVLRLLGRLRRGPERGHVFVHRHRRHAPVRRAFRPGTPADRPVPVGHRGGGRATVLQAGLVHRHRAGGGLRPGGAGRGHGQP